MRSHEPQLAAHRFYTDDKREALQASSASEVYKRKPITLPSSLRKPSLRAYFDWDDRGNEDYAKRPTLLDLFAGAGGAAMGYYLAGFRIIGIDLHPQPHFPFEFHQGDALEYLAAHGNEFDAIHASPPCQFATGIKNLGRARNGGYPERHVNLIPQTRVLLMESGLPYVIENVAGAKKHLINPVMLCGSQFGLHVYRHRFFETNFYLRAPDHYPHRDSTPSAGNGKSPKGFISVCGTGGVRGMDAQEIVDYWQYAMGIDWTRNRHEIAEAIPPAYTEWIGKQLIDYLGAR